MPFQSLSAQGKVPQYVKPYFIAMAHVALGNNDAAFEWLKSAPTNMIRGWFGLVPNRNSIGCAAIPDSLKFSGRQRIRWLLSETWVRRRPTCSSTTCRAVQKPAGRLRTQAGRYRSRYCNGVKRPLAPQLINRPVEDIDIHVVFRAGNGVQASASLRGTAILFTGKLPDRVGFPRALRKVCHRASEPRIPKPRLRKHLIRAVLFRDRFRDFVVPVNEGIASGLFF